MGAEYRVGYTTGVFDMFHIGHLNILKAASERCGRLIVGVSTDELAEAYKGKKPIIPFAERIEIVSSIKYVNEAVPQLSLDKREAWEKLHYDVLFHGSDWKGSSMYDNVIDELKEVGVKVEFLPHTEGISSTMLLKKIQFRGFWEEDL